MESNNFNISIRKTKKITIDENVHILPPDLGPFEEFKVADYFCPDEWSKDGIFIKVEEGMPFWIDFRPNQESAVLVSVQRLNPATGEAINLDAGLNKEPKQNYLKLPEQLWLDGFLNDGKVYQFVVTKAGEGLAVNEYILPKYMQDSHAIGFAFYLPKNPKPIEIQTPIWFPLPPLSSPLRKTTGFSPLYCQTITSSGTTNAVFGQPYCLLPNKTDHETLTSVGFLDNDMVFTNDIRCTSLDEITYKEKFDEPETIDILEQQKTFDKASIGVGGRIDQLVRIDENTVDYYKKEPAAILTVYLALPEQFDFIINKGKREDSTRKDQFVHSGKISGTFIPLV